MKFEKLGTDTSVEITNISSHGVWVLVDDGELFMSFDQFPWFRDVAVASILEVEWQGPDHLYWPKLDVDLSIESIRDPDKFPLISKQRG